MKTVQVEFPGDYHSDKPAPIWCGGLSIGRHHVRMGFCPDGQMRLYIPEGALKDGSVVVLPTPDLSKPLGFKG